MSSHDVIFVKSCIILDDKIDVVVKFPATSDKRVFATIAGICAILTCTAIYLNACIVVTIWKIPVLREKLSKFTIMMQSTVHLLQGAFVMPLFWIRCAERSYRDRKLFSDIRLQTTYISHILILTYYFFCVEP